MLHLIADSTLTQTVVDRIATADDVVLLASVLAVAFAGHQDNVHLQSLLSRNCRIYALSDQLAMNGIGDAELFPGVQVIDYPKLVDLTVQNPVIHTWR